MALTPERKAQMDAVMQQGTKTSVLTPERRAQMDAVLSGQQPTQTQPGGFQRFVQGIAKPFIHEAAAIPALIEGGAKLVTGDVKGANEALTKERNFGYLGSARPVGVNEQGQAEIGQGKTGQFLKDVVGTAAEIGSYVVPAGEASNIARATVGGAVKEGILIGANTGLVSGMLGQGGAELAKPDSTVGSVVGQTLLGGAIGAGTGGLLGGTASAVGKGVNKVAPLLSEEGRKAATISGRRAELSRLGDSYAPLRKVLQKNPERSDWIKDFLSQNDFLVGASDKTGTIRTTQRGGAVEQLQNFIRPQEDIVARILERDGNTVPLEVIKRKLTSAVEKSGAKGAARVRALRAVADEIEGLRLDMDATGSLPLSAVHDAKVDKYSTINYLNPETKRLDKAIAKALKELVEEHTTSADIRAINSELSRYYDALSFLEKLDGKKVEGGRLGKYFAQTIGAIVGGHVGGPVGSVVGAEVGGRIRGAQLASKFGRATGNVPKTPAILEEAQRIAREPKKPLLGLPAPDPSKSGPIINLGGPTEFEPRANIVGGEGQNPKMGLLQRPLSLPEPTGFTGEPIRAGQATTYEPRAKIVGNESKVIDAKATIVNAKDLVKKLRGRKSKKK